jgi:carboxyl-terminal processing protease
MPRRVCFRVWTLLVSALFFSSPVWAQQPPSTPIVSVSPRPSVIGDLLSRGRTLEGERRWGEALTLYEDALRQYPTQRDLEQRLQLSRMHYDLGRRYNDRTFRDSVVASSGRQALDLYAEVLLKIQSHYVETPDWRRLAEYGAASLEIALADPLFIETNLPKTAPAQIDHFRRHIRSQLKLQQVNSRHAAQDIAGAAARLGRSQLGLSESAVVQEFICGAANSLDTYSAFLTPGQLNEVYSQIDGNFVGLGVELKADHGALLIENVIGGSPAERAGIRPADRIVAVDGRSTAELSTDQAANLLQGKEGSMVDVTAVTPGQPPRDLRIRREHVEVPSIVDPEMVDPDYGVAYLKLTCFQKTTSADLDVALHKLHRQGMKSLIIDLRKNPGGLLNTAVDVVDKFVDRGTIVSTRGRSRQEDYTYTAREAGTWRIPLVVLIDGDSASASEIFAGAIRDYRRGRIVGTRSYGKGSVQGIFPLNMANSGLRLTTAKFYSPFGRPFSGVGVEPDVAVAHKTARPDLDKDGENLAAATDEALAAAIREARQQTAQR